MVLHIPATGRSLLAPILDRHGPLEAVLAAHGERLRRGVIYVAPADRHLLVREQVVELSRGPKENGVRPAADPLFRSLARAWGPYAVAVVLSGALDDGASGAAAVAEAGGTVVVQDPDDALVTGMPASTIAGTTPDDVVPVAHMAGVLRRIVELSLPGSEGEPAMATGPDPDEMRRGPNRPEGPASGFTCPECGGALWELRQGERTRYRCRVGHSYSEGAMVEAQGASVEAALWAALAGARGARRAAAADRRPQRREAPDRAALPHGRVRGGRARGADAGACWPPPRRRGGGGRVSEPEDPSFEALLEFLEHARAASTSPATSARACSAGCRRRMAASAASRSATISTTSRSIPTSSSSCSTRS